MNSFRDTAIRSVPSEYKFFSTNNLWLIKRDSLKADTLEPLQIPGENPDGRFRGGGTDGRQFYFTTRTVTFNGCASSW